MRRLADLASLPEVIVEGRGDLVARQAEEDVDAGDWMSVSITPTRLPRAESTAAMFAVVFDLPVPPRKEWIETIVAINRPAARCARTRRARLDVCG